MAKAAPKTKRALPKKASVARKPIGKRIPKKKLESAKKTASKKKPTKATTSPSRSLKRASVGSSQKVSGTKSKGKSEKLSTTIMLTNGAEMPLMGFGTFGIKEVEPIE